MEKVLHPYDKERMRLAMLKHEETFREQVYELHRLYRIQKMLMDSDGLRQQQQRQKTITIGHQNHHQQDAQRNGDDKSMSNNNIVVGLIEQCDDQVRIGSNDQERIAESNSKMMLDEKEIELTLSLGPSAHNPRPERADKSESGQSISSSSTGSSQTRKTSPKNSSLITRGDQQLRWGTRTGSSTTFPQGSESKPGFSNGQQTGTPPWLFHALSLKLT